ncbi:hypothetical protein FB451DRAFT_1173620 [Mycena latifolia]|nr:hypothetical protein FB451DRAFT_1173620 [Mycena latifolia]
MWFTFTVLPLIASLVVGVPLGPDTSIVCFSNSQCVSRFMDVAKVAARDFTNARVAKDAAGTAAAAALVDVRTAFLKAVRCRRFYCNAAFGNSTSNGTAMDAMNASLAKSEKAKDAATAAAAAAGVNTNLTDPARAAAVKVLFGYAMQAQGAAASASAFATAAESSLVFIKSIV